MNTIKSKIKSFGGKVPYAKRLYHLAKQKLNERDHSLPSIWNPENVRFFVETKAQKYLNDFLESDGRLIFSVSPAPLVSIIIVLYNRAELTLHCLRSLQAFDYLGLEIIVVDNCSTDRTSELIPRVTGIKYILNTENQHFLKGTNQGAGVSTGQYLLLLNSDTDVLPGSLEAALNNFERDSKVGAVGAKLILPDGSLQEAGSLIWNDGSCLGYGRGDDPNRAPYQFRRPVDFCSGAFLLMKRELWQTLHGLDEQFAPAYYEEVDLCLRIWEKGFHVLYDPRVVVHHFEFASSKNKEAAFVLQRANQQKFLSRHRTALIGRPEQSSAAVLQLRERDIGKKKVLWIDERIPHAHYGAGYPRAQLLIHLLTEMNCRVTLFPALHVDGDETWRRVYHAVPRDVEVLAKAGCGPGRLEQFVKDRVSQFDLIVISRPDTMKEVRKILAKQPGLIDLNKVIYDAEAIFTLREELEARILGKEISVEKLKRRKLDELSLTDGVRTVMTVSEREAKEFSDYGCRDVRLVSHAAEPYVSKTPYAGRAGMVFIGSIFGDGGPNYDSMMYFCTEVLPLLRKEGCEEKVYVIGHNLSQNLKNFAHLGVELVGAVDDLNSWYERGKLFIAPTRFSAGIPLKVIEASAHGVPCVITSLLSSQLGAPKNIFTLINTPQDFAQETLSLLNSEELWKLAQQKQTEFILSKFDPANIKTTFEQLVLARPA